MFPDVDGRQRAAAPHRQGRVGIGTVDHGELAAFEHQQTPSLPKRTVAAAMQAALQASVFARFATTKGLIRTSGSPPPPGLGLRQSQPWRVDSVFEACQLAQFVTVVA